MSGIGPFRRQMENMFPFIPLWSLLLCLPLCLQLVSGWVCSSHPVECRLAPMSEAEASETAPLLTSEATEEDTYQQVTMWPRAGAINCPYGPGPSPRSMRNRFDKSKCFGKFIIRQPLGLKFMWILDVLIPMCPEKVWPICLVDTDLSKDLSKESLIVQRGLRFI